MKNAVDKLEKVQRFSMVTVVKTRYNKLHTDVQLM